ncbi:MAG: ABC transporter ATP-binding protein, partial [Lachnospiraceae bacterium]|nr:ABC transporter ATP-binding protein [Lachnospiraceae bacterium]
MKSNAIQNMLQNTGYMLSVAWQQSKSVIWFCLLLAVFPVAANLLGLLFIPTLLFYIETAVPLRQLLLGISLFAGGTMLISAAEGYVSSNILFGRIQ